LLNDPQISQALGEIDLLSTYRLKIKGNLTEKDREKLLKGMKIDDRFVKIKKFLSFYKRGEKSVVVLSFTHRFPSLLVKMFLRREVSVVSMTRLTLGPLKLGNLKGGEAREATTEEVKALRKALKLL